MAEGDRSLYTAPSTWYVTHPGNQTTGTITQDTLYLWPFELPARMKVDTLRIDVTTAASAGGILRAGIYGSADGGLPDFTRLLLDFGSLVTTATGLVDATPTAVVLPRERLYLAAVGQVAAASYRVVTGWAPSAPLPVAAAAFSGIALVGYTRTGVSGALPTSGSLTGMTNTVPLRTFLHTAA